MKSINDLLKQEADKNKTPSIQYIFFDLDSTIYEFRDGYSDIKANSRINAATTYHFFSITKTVTALAVLQLAQSGKIRLNDPMVDYLPGFPYANEITIEQVLNHSSGIPNPLPLRWTHLSAEHDDFDRNRFFNQVFKKNNQLKFIPGTKFSYSNLGYVLLGQLIEKVSGKKYETYVEENIFDKARIDGSELGFAIKPSVQAKGYQKSWSLTNALLSFLIDKKKYMGPAEGRWKPFLPFYINGISYGGMIGSAGGLVKYARALLRNDSEFLHEDYKKKLFTESIIDQKPTGMAFSWFTGDLKGNKYYAHAGGGGGYYVELRLYPGLGVASTILYNRSGMRDERMLDKTDGFFLTSKR